MKEVPLSLERFLGTVVPGGLLLAILWYLYRPFLALNFPQLAGDPSVTETALSTESKLLLLVPVSLAVGIVINYFSDLTLAALYYPWRRARGVLDRILQVGTWAFRPRGLEDPRLLAVGSYLQSPRKQRFLNMIEDWAGVTEEEAQSRRGAAITIEHIAVRMRTLSPNARDLVASALAHVNFTASVFTAILIAIPLSALSWLVALAVQSEVLVAQNRVYPAVLLAEILVGYLFAFWTVARFRHFCSQVLTLGLHYHAQDAKSDKAEANAAVLAERRRTGVEEYLLIPRGDGSTATSAEGSGEPAGQAAPAPGNNT